jgi:signal transduction histidine kinase
MGKTKDIRAAVEDELTFDPLVDPSGIRVENMGGDVALNGMVPSYPQYLAAAAAARRVAGGDQPAQPPRGGAALGDIVMHAVDDAGLRSVTVCLPAGLPEVMADPELMERVIENLTRNALQYSPPGKPPLLTARAYGSRVELRVIGRGPGIPRAERTCAFLPFQRLGDTGTSTGVGLGLALSRGLTEAMGGTLDLHETPGGGLTMVVSLPAARRAERVGVPGLIGAEPSG